MDALLTGIIAVAAMLLGFFAAYRLQARSAEQARAFEREERRHQERLEACIAFAGAVTEFKKALINLWFYSWDASATEAAKVAGAACDRLGASTEIARFRVHLVSADPELMVHADAAHSAAGAVLKSADRSDLHAREAQFEQALKAFITTAAERSRHLPSPPVSRRPGMQELFSWVSGEASAQLHGAGHGRPRRPPARAVPHPRTRHPQ